MTGLGGILFQYLPYAGLFVGILIGFEGLRQVVARSEDLESERTRRMQSILDRTGGKTLLLHGAVQKGWQGQLPFYNALSLRMQQAGMKMKVGPFVAFCAFCGIVAYLIWSKFLGFGVAIMPAMFIGAGLPVIVVSNFRRRRIDKFSAQLPDALDLMMRGLRIGHPISATLSNVVENMQDPIAAEFALVANQIEYGEDLVSAFMNMADRIDQEDMYYLAASIGIQHGTGGNLAGMLGTLSKVIRSRAMMRRRIKAISSEGRISAMILSALPVLIFGFTTYTAPGYYTKVQDDPIFMPMAIAVVVFLLANFLTLRKLSSFKI